MISLVRSGLCKQKNAERTDYRYVGFVKTALLALMIIGYSNAAFGQQDSVTVKTNRPPPPNSMLLDEPIEFQETFEAGSAGNAISFQVTNTTAYPIFGLSLRPSLPAQWMTMERLEPSTTDLKPGEEIEFIVEFKVRKEAPEGAIDIVDFHFEAESTTPIPASRYRMVAAIEAAEEELAQCNSAVEEGGDAGGGVSVDLGGFTGKAGFSWQMHNIKDSMMISIGGVQKTTGCVSGTGTIELDIPANATTAVVTVTPNCTGNTSNTKWSFEFECPLRSAVTADGTGKSTPTSQSGTNNAASNTGSQATAGANPVPSSPFAGLTGSTTGSVQPIPAGGAPADQEPNNNVTTATPVVPSTTISGSIAKPGDADYFSMITKVPGVWELRIEPVSATASFGLGVHHAGGGNWLADNSAKGDGRLVVDIKWPGKYVLRVVGVDAQTPNTPYRVVATFHPSPDKYEPNDSVGTANSTNPTGTTVGSIMPKGDADYHIVDLNRQGEWIISINAKPDNLNLALGVHSAAGGNWLTDNSPKGDNKIVVDIKWPGKYVLRVTDTNGARSADPYVIESSFNSSVETSEPNDSVGTAGSISPTGTVTGTILPKGDADYRIIDIAKQGRWSISVAQTPPGMVIGLGVHHAGGGNWLADQSPKGDKKLVVDLARPGKYILRATDINGTRSIEPYKLNLKFVESPDEHEPNNAVAIAADISINSTIIGTILPKGDADYFQVDIGSQGEWVIDDIISPPGMNPALGVHSSGGGNWLTDNSPKGDGRLVIDIKRPGKYVLRATDANGISDVVPYKFRSSFSIAPDSHEPNDTTGLAAQISANTTITSAILPKGDQDYFIVELPGKGRWTINIDQQPSRMNIALGVHSAKGGNWLADKSPKGDGKLEVEIKEAGKYILRALDSNGGRNVQGYKLTTRFN